MKSKIELYHYKPLCTLEHLSHLQNYLNQRIWLTKLEDFNDPFEASFSYVPLRAEEILASEKIFDRYFCHLLKSNPGLNKKDFRSALSSPDADTIVGQRLIVDEFFKSHGAICLASSGANIPMWAHYANDHQGYCVIFEIDTDIIYQRYSDQHKQNGTEYARLEFDELINKVFYPNAAGTDQEILSFKQPQDDSDKQFIFTKIIYKKDPPCIKEEVLEEILQEKQSGDLYRINKYLAQHSFSVKFDQWSYEEEYRLVVNANSNQSGLMHLKGYPFIKITGIIMGKNIGKSLNKDAVDFIRRLELSGNVLLGDDFSEKTRNFIANLGQQHGIKVYLAECSKDVWKIKWQEYSGSNKS